MPKKLHLAFVLCLVLCAHAQAGIELFGKGSVSKNYIDVDNSTLEVDVAGGIAFTLFTGIRLEARYSNISAVQNKLDVVSSTLVGTLSNINTQTVIYSLGLDIDFLGDKSAFQPYVYVGAGYMETTRSYYYTAAGATTSTYFSEPNQAGISANAGAGFRIRLAKSLALEFEVFAYGLNVDQPGPLINYFGSAGLRVFI